MELVTPLKPLEAMALGKAILASDVGGLRELLPDGTAMIFQAGVPRDLGRKCMDLIADADKRTALGNKAREYVRGHRDWGKVVRNYSHVYSFAVEVSG